MKTIVFEKATGKILIVYPYKSILGGVDSKCDYKWTEDSISEEDILSKTTNISQLTSLITPEVLTLESIDERLKILEKKMI